MRPVDTLYLLGLAAIAGASGTVVYVLTSVSLLPSLVAPGDLPRSNARLELARAYEEMGDKEGALELLEEVVSEGSPRQQVTARDMIARLG